ncbi:glycoside hydrolase 15-related [Caballeronia choica]|jgi:GH15 family glucan-1,4-alpha-glucosidase|uniref:Glycoside hydrolase 15-related n=1 Tax=Caballeronia choica TaxID=326476 RepID=A0A158KZR2_9BURK|nr:glycoside hydrolase family 15 protein [Caballeronia choica]SAL86612.1 glycoside hydrolase 15-related [Caballeronia choica]
MAARIEDYALLGDGRSAALVDRHGSIDWLCWPSFDSDTCFAALLGDARNGRWRIAPRKPVLSAKRCYRGDGLILETTLVAGPSTVILTDWMVWGATPPVLARRVRCEGAPVSIECELTVRFDYGRAVPWSKQAGSRVQLMAGPQTFWLDSSAELDCVGNDVRVSFNMAPGEQRDFSLTCVPSTSPPPAVPDLNTALDTTAAFWSGWSARSAATGPYAEAIQRSMVTLKALTSLETGGVIAAPTSSLPEAIGGQRNWDYRFCWLRDASFTLKALLAGGYHDEAARWRDWLVRAIGGDPAQVQIMYALDGTRRVDEWECTWLPGYEHSAPVRFGNAAVGQLQLDVYGEVLNALYVCRQAGLPPDDDAWSLEQGLVAHLGNVWREPDHGIWEARSGRKAFTLSKVMAWVAVDRALRSAQEFGEQGHTEDWRRLAERIREDVLAHGFNRHLNTFTQIYGGNTLDAGLLLIPLTGFLRADDPRVSGTVDAIEHALIEDGLVLRYRIDAANSELGGGEGAFLACAFWLAHVRYLQGRESEARALFERLLELRNDVGLLSEEYDFRRKRLCGNFPQAFSHVALVNAGMAMTAGRRVAPDDESSARSGAEPVK